MKLSAYRFWHRLPVPFRFRGMISADIHDGGAMRVAYGWSMSCALIFRRRCAYMELRIIAIYNNALRSHCGCRSGTRLYFQKERSLITAVAAVASILYYRMSQYWCFWLISIAIAGAELAAAIMMFIVMAITNRGMVHHRYFIRAQKA